MGREPVRVTKATVSTVVKGAGESQVGRNLAQVSTPVLTNVFTCNLQLTLGFTTSKVRVLAKAGYDTHDAVLYCNYTDIK